MNGRPEPDTPDAWLLRARSDLAAGRAILGAPGVLPEDAAFHAQQCAEKAIKALLVHHRQPFPRTHVLEFLLDLLEQAGIAVPPEIQDAVQLTQYAVEVRYPGLWQAVSSEEASEALHTAERILDWAERQVRL